MSNTVASTAYSALGFALAVWAYRETGSATTLSLILASIVIPGAVLAGPLGRLVDRSNKKHLLSASHAMSAAAAIGGAVLALTDQLELWHMCAISSVYSVALMLGSLSTQVLITALVPPAQIGRALALGVGGSAAAEAFGPLGGGLMLERISIGHISAIAGVGGIAAATATMLLSIDAASAPARARERDRPWRAIEFVRAHPGIAWLVTLIPLRLFVAGTARVLLPVMVLARHDAATLGFVMSAGGVGLAVALVGLTAWGEPRRRVGASMLFHVLCSAALLALSTRVSAPVMIAAFAAVTAFEAGQFVTVRPVLHRKVPEEIQGRFFALVEMLGTGARGVALLGMGFVSERAERFFAADADGRAASVVLATVAVISVLFAAGVWASRSLRRVETDLPDVAGKVPIRGSEASRPGSD